MRVHPTVIQGSSSKIPLVAGGVLVTILLAANLFKKDPPPPPPSAPTQVVVVAKALIQAQQKLTSDNIALEARLIASIPPEPFTTLEAVSNQLAAGIIPPNSVITHALIVDPTKSVKPTTPAPVIDPCDTKIAKLKEQKASLTVPFNTTAPPRCSRIVVSVQTPKGIIPIADQVVTEKIEGNVVRLLVDADRIRLFEEARSRGGQFSYVELPEGLSSPYQDRIPTLEQFLANFPTEQQPTIAPPKETKPEEECTGLVKADGNLYCTNKKKWFILDSDTGKWVETNRRWIDDAKKNVDERKRPKGKSTEQTESAAPIEEKPKLEPLYPLSGLESATGKK